MKKFNEKQYFAAVIVAGTLGLSLTACGTTTTVREIPIAAAPAPAVTVTVAAPVQNIINNNPAPAMPVYVAPVTVADPSGDTCVTLDAAGYCPDDDPAPALTTDPYSVVSQYFSDVNSSDITDAWNLLGPSEQDGWNSDYSTYDTWASPASFSNITEDSESGDTVTVTYTQSGDESPTTYTVTFVVDNGIITSDNWSQNY
jgi:hypothetical protein